MRSRRTLVGGAIASAIAIVAIVLAVALPERGRGRDDTVARDVPTSTTAPTTAPSTSTSTTTSTTTTAVPEPCPARPLSVCRGRLAVDGVVRPVLGINAPNASSALRFGSPCGSPDADLDVMFGLLPDRALVRVWFTQRTARDGDPPQRAWDRLDEVVAAAERAPTRPLLVVTLAASAGYCDGDQWRDRAWYDGGYAQGPDPGVSNSYLGWVDEVVARYASRDVVAMWEPVNEADASTCLPGHPAPCFGHSACAPGAAESLAAFFSVVGERIHALDADAIVSTGGRGWCGWSTPEEVDLIERTPSIDVISVHEYPQGAELVSGTITGAADDARRLHKPLYVGELGLRTGPGRPSVAERARELVARASAQIEVGASAVALWNFGYGTPCDLCLMPDDPVYPLLRDLTVAIVDGH